MSFELIIPFLRPIEPLLLDESISEIMGNPDSSWWYERDGIMRRDESIQFDAARLRTGLEVVANKLGKKLDEDNPLLNAQLPDGSRLAAVIPPVVRPAPAMVIRTSAFTCGLPGQPDRTRPNHPYQWRNRDREDHASKHSWPVDSRP
jgi:pilus assembly protein CpaF